MASINELALQYRKRLERSVFKKQEAIKILSEINNLVYEGSKQKLSKEDKIKIIKQIGTIEVISEMHHSYRSDIRKSSNDEYIELIELMLKGVE